MVTKLLLFTILLMSAVSCTYNQPVIKGYEIYTKKIKNIAIIPFDYDRTADKAPIPEDFMPKFNDHLYQRLSAGLTGVKVIDLEKSYEAINMLTRSISRESIRFIPAFCEITGCDSALSGNIKEYGERVGGEYGVEYPASFSFVTKLHDGKTGNILWKDYYYEKQKPLLENVVEVGKFIKRKGKYVSPEEIAYEGIEELVVKLNNLLQ